ncbi:GNAT family N-acetyltransferase [Streptococcus hyovaginalis]
MIRQLNPSDIQIYRNELYELLFAVYNSSFHLPIDSTKNIVNDKLEQMYEIINNSSGYIIAYFDGIKICGFAWYFKKIDFEKSSYFLNFISTFPKYQNKGIGNALIHYIEERAKENGIRYLELNVTSDNSLAVYLYEKNNFKEIRKIMIKDIFKND